MKGNRFESSPSYSYSPNRFLPCVLVPSASFRFTPVTRLLCNSTNVGATPIVTAANPVQTVTCPRGCTAKINAGPVYGNKASWWTVQGAAAPVTPSLQLGLHY